MIDADFLALDVETANENYWSICQVGIAFFKNEQLINSWGTLVNPETYFDDFNIGIHGITKEKVKTSPKLHEMYDQVKQIVGTNIVAHHMPFDRLAFSRCAEKLKQPPLSSRWVDTARVARHSWQDVSQRGYSLENLTRIFSIPLEHHHNAVDDAQAAGFILIKAAQESGISFNNWVSDYFEYYNSNGELHIHSLPSYGDKEFRNLANAEPKFSGPLFGEVVVFTGELSISRLEAAQVAYEMGCNIDTDVTRKTTLLVVGDQDLKKLAGYEKSSKQRKAEDLRSKGQNIKIINENDFMTMVNY